MKEQFDLYELPIEMRQIDIIHVLNSGQIITSKNEFEEVKDKFAWVDQNEIRKMILELRPKTDSSRKSAIIIYETHEIKVFPNISRNFTQYKLLSNSL